MDGHPTRPRPAVPPASRHPVQRPEPQALWRAQARSLSSGLGLLWETPAMSGLTVGVLAVTLTLPTGAHLLLHHLQWLVTEGPWRPRISLFLDVGVEEARGRRLADNLEKWHGLTQVEVISPAQALQALHSFGEIGTAVDALGSNPLPWVLLIDLDLERDTAATRELAEKLRDLDEVQFLHLDPEWAERLHGLLGLSRRAALIAALVAGLAWLVVVSHTIRLKLAVHQEEIWLIGLLGGTAALLRQPFVYAGFWLGLASGLLAWAMARGAMALLADPLHDLAGAYGADHPLDGLGVAATLALTAGSGLLGLLAAWMAVTWQGAAADS